MPLQFLEQRDPIHPRALHGYRFYCVFFQPSAYRLQIHCVVPKCPHNLRFLTPRNTHHDLHCADVHSRRIRIYLAHPCEWMRFFLSLRALAFSAHSILLLSRCFWQARPLHGFSFLIGVALPRHQYLNQFDRKPRCTAGLRLRASPLLCTACMPANYEYTFTRARVSPG